jgi:hypothetical protein
LVSVVFLIYSASAPATTTPVKPSKACAKVYRFSGSAVEVGETVPDAAPRVLDGVTEVVLGLGLADALLDDRVDELVVVDDFLVVVVVEVVGGGGGGVYVVVGVVWVVCVVVGVVWCVVLVVVGVSSPPPSESSSNHQVP